MKQATIYLAVHNKVFGPFAESELASLTLSDYRWIYRTTEASRGWQPLDQKPTAIPVPGDGLPQRAIAYVSEHATAVSGTLQEVRARGGWLESEESRIRLQIGAPVRLQLVGDELRSLQSRVERIETSPRGVRYRLSWAPETAP